MSNTSELPRHGGVVILEFLVELPANNIYRAIIEAENRIGNTNSTGFVEISKLQ